MKTTSIVALLTGLISTVSAQTCSNLGGWLAQSVLGTYSHIAGYMYTTDSSKSCLLPGNYIGTCLRLSNPAQNTMLVLQPDGNAVVYSVWYASTCNYGNGCISPVWSTGSNNQGVIAVKLNNGKFYVDTAIPNTGGTVKWDSGKIGSVSGTRLCMQNDGNLVLYDSNYSVVVWNSGTNR
ncbi:UNVERIFIED_CONTAM: hypothetical protein HDU68_008179 [Siphonaria sp. JEL0065]|nr:hypothetical protein HDU68_008179 [Siphonaria sp. JEL0065]